MDDDYLVLEKGCKRDSWVLQMLTKEHIDSLEQIFQHTHIPHVHELESIAAHLNISDDYVRIWFRYRLFDHLALRHRRRYMPFFAA